MIDRSVEYHSIFMRCSERSVRAAREISLPDGYHYSLYRSGMGTDWADICCDAGLFPSLGAALSLFNRDFLPHYDELIRRMWFILDENNRPIATTSAWFTEKHGERMGMIHWVAARPDVQRRGLGRAIVTKALAELARLETERRACLDTNTQSWQAVCLYQSLGFRSEIDPEHPGELSAAANVLRGTMPGDQLTLLARPIGGVRI